MGKRRAFERSQKPKYTRNWADARTRIKGGFIQKAYLRALLIRNEVQPNPGFLSNPATGQQGPAGGARSLASHSSHTLSQANKALREEAKLKEFALDAKFRKEWEAILDKQEKERTDRLNANHVKQTLQVRRKGEGRGTSGKAGRGSRHCR